MSWLNWLTGQPNNDRHDDRVERAERYIVESGGHGIADHYNMQGVRDSIRQWAGMPDFTIAESIDVVNRVRAQRGWGTVAEDEYLSDDPEIPQGYCSKCGFTHSGRACW